MAKIELQPEVYEVYNNFDRHGLLLSLQRLPGEKNALYKRRLEDVMVHLAGAHYQGLIHGMTREFGLSLKDSILIKPVKDINGNTLLDFPGVVFKDTKCYLYSNIEEKIIFQTLDRFDFSGNAYSIEELITTINNTGYWEVELLNDELSNRSMTLYNQSSVDQVFFENISGKGNRISLDNNDLLENSIAISSDNLLYRVSSINEVSKNGDYFIDLENGFIFSAQTPAPGSAVSYKYNKEEFIVRSSPVILHNLQSDDFKTKMFQIIEDNERGLPTTLGADIINELLSVYASLWGK